jgi:TRAP-type C4-dicarboxylate transport system substrate-binding protein
MCDGVARHRLDPAGLHAGTLSKVEVFELPFLPTTGEETSRAFWTLYESEMQDQFPDAKVIAAVAHGPGLIHARGEGVRRLEDMAGMKLRGPTRVITDLLATLGATPVGMPAPAIPEALSRGVVDGAVIPWEVTAPLKLHELVDTHTGFAGDHGLSLRPCSSMNKKRYEALPDDLKAVIDANSGPETSAWAGRVLDEGDAPERRAAEAHGNEIIVPDEAEVARWKGGVLPFVASDLLRVAILVAFPAVTLTLVRALH